MTRPRTVASNPRYPSADVVAHRAHRDATYPACPLCINASVHRAYGVKVPSTRR
jgi:hypothetical protein